MPAADPLPAEQVRAGVLLWIGSEDGFQLRRGEEAMRRQVQPAVLGSSLPERCFRRLCAAEDTDLPLRKTLLEGIAHCQDFAPGRRQRWIHQLGTACSG